MLYISHPIEHLIETIPHMRPHGMIRFSHASRTQSSGKRRMKVGWQCLSMRGNVVKPVEDENLLSFDRCPQTWASAQFPDPHMKLHVIGVDRKQECRVDRLGLT